MSLVISGPTSISIPGGSTSVMQQYTTTKAVTWSVTVTGSGGLDPSDYTVSISPSALPISGKTVASFAEAALRRFRTLRVAEQAEVVGELLADVDLLLVGPRTDEHVAIARVRGLLGRRGIARLPRRSAALTAPRVAPLRRLHGSADGLRAVGLVLAQLALSTPDYPVGNQEPLLSSKAHE